MRKIDKIRFARIIVLFVIFTILNLVFGDVSYIVVFFLGMVTELIDNLFDPVYKDKVDKTIGKNDIADTANLIIEVFEDTLDELEFTNGADDLGYKLFETAEQTKSYNLYKKQELKDNIISKIESLFYDDKEKKQ